MKRTIRYCLLVLTACTSIIATKSNVFGQAELPVLADPPGNPQVMFFIDDSGSMNAIMEHPNFSPTSAVATNTSNDIPSVIFRLESGAAAPTTSHNLRPVLVEMNTRFGSGSGSLWGTTTLSNAAANASVVLYMGCVASNGGLTNCPAPGPTTPQSGSNAGHLFGNTAVYGNSIYGTANLAKVLGVNVVDTSGHEYLYVKYKKELYGNLGWDDVWYNNGAAYDTRVFATNGGTVVFNGKQVFLSKGWYRIEYLRWIFYGATTQELATLPGVTRIDAVRNTVKTLINNNPSIRYGLATLNGTSVTAGTWSGNLYDQWYNVAGNTSTGGAIIRKDIGTTNATLITTINSLGARGGTPLTNRYIEILRYFHGETDNDANANRTYPSPMTGSTAACDGYFIVMLTDGLPTAETANSVFGGWITDLDGDLEELPDASNNGCSPSSDCSKWLDDAAYLAHTYDFNSSLANTQSITTYSVGLGINYTLLDSVAQNGGTGQSYLASTANEISDTLTNIVRLIITSPIAGAGAALAETFGEAGMVYRPRFYADTWTGGIDVYQYNESTDTLDFQFDMATVLEDRDLATEPRNIIAGYDTDGDGRTNQSIAFDTTQASALRPLIFSRFISGTESTTLLEPLISDIYADTSATAVIRYITGYAYDDDFRVRDRNANSKVDRLGDIVYSRPIEIGPRNGNYNSMIGYTDYTKSKASEPRILVVGSNDGMMHGFDSETGAELWAYIPSSVIPYLERQTRITYNAEYRRSLVDASPRVEDVYVNGAWRTYLMFGQRKGGSTYTVLDISNRSNPVLVWEVSDAASAGESWSNPTVVITGGGSSNDPSAFSWYMVVGTGENKSTAGTNILAYSLSSVAPPAATVKAISAADPAGTRTSSIIAIQDDNDFAVDRIYIGTEEGDMFRVAVNGAPAGWTTTKLFDGNSNQPIVAAPAAVLVDNPQYTGAGSGVASMRYAVGLYWGTGRYDTTADINGVGALAQMITGIFDPVNPSGDAYANVLSGLTTANLQNQTPASFNVVRSLTDGIYRVPNTKAGFFINLDTSINLAAGNYINPVGLVQYEPINLRGAILFSTFLPDHSACGVGGYGFLQAMNYRTGGGFVIDRFLDSDHPFYNGGLPDYNNDTLVNTTDLNEGYDHNAFLPAIDVHVESVNSNTTTPYVHDGDLLKNDIRLHSSNGGLIPSVSSLGIKGAPVAPSILRTANKIIIQSAYPAGTQLGNPGGGQGSGGSGGSGGSSGTIPPPDQLPIDIYNLPIDLLSFHEDTDG